MISLACNPMRTWVFSATHPLTQINPKMKRQFSAVLERWLIIRPYFGALTTGCSSQRSKSSAPNCTHPFFNGFHPKCFKYNINKIIFNLLDLFTSYNTSCLKFVSNNTHKHHCITPHLPILFVKLILIDKRLNNVKISLFNFFMVVSL